MTDPMTATDLDAIERRFAEGRVVNIAAQRQLLAEVRRLRAAEQRISKVARELRYTTADTYDTIERILAALDGEQ